MADHQGLLSKNHFTIDGTLIEASASLKSFKPKDGNPPSDDRDPGNPSVDFHGQKRSNATHQNATDSESRLCKKGKGKEAKLVLMAHALIENRNGLVTDFQVTSAAGTAEFNVALAMLGQAKERGFHVQTLGAVKGYDSRDCVAALRKREATPHMSQNTRGRRSVISGRTTQHPGRPMRQRAEEIFGWMNPVGGLRRTRCHGLAKMSMAGCLVATAHNLVRTAKLLVSAQEETPVTQAE